MALLENNCQSFVEPPKSHDNITHNILHFLHRRHASTGVGMHSRASAYGNANARPRIRKPVKCLLRFRANQVSYISNSCSKALRQFRLGRNLPHSAFRGSTAY